MVIHEQLAPPEELRPPPLWPLAVLLGLVVVAALARVVEELVAVFAI